MSKLLEIAYEHLTPKQKHKALKMAMRKLLELEKQGSKKAKAALDKIRATKDDLVKELIGKNPEGQDIYEDSRGIRFYKQGEATIYENVAISGGNLDLSGRTDEHRTIEEAAEKARAILRKKLGDNQLYSGVDPEIMAKVLAIGIKASTLYLAKGAVKFSIWADNMIAGLSVMGISQDTIEPHLKQLYLVSKMGASPEVRKQMDKEDDVYDFDFAALNTNQEQTQESTLKWWWPQTTERYQSVLAVQTTESEMTPQLHSLLMESKLRRLVQEDETPQETMMMSMEHLPEMFQIAQETEVSNYATAIMYSDSMNALMHKIIWPLETTEIQEEQQETIQEWTEGQTLMDVLEKM